MNIGRLSQVELRKVWQHEALDFTNWLSLPENLAILSEEIGLEISDAQTEVNVGSFHVDILAEEENTGRKIIIENQLESTNHDHLGKLITYASGLDAPIVVWIVKSAREEHTRAVDWLNEHTDEEINFFIIKMEVWQIGDSAVAPKFQIISRPNDWAKAVKSSGAQKLSEHKLKQQRFWTEFKEFAKNSKKLRLRKPSPQHWYDISIGKSYAHISLSVNSVNNTLGCEIYIPNDEDKAVITELSSQKSKIEKELVGYKLEWMPLLGKKASRIKTSRHANFDDENLWPEYFEWLRDTAERLHSVFGKYL
jgi:hypothetical protein